MCEGHLDGLSSFLPCECWGWKGWWQVLLPEEHLAAPVSFIKWRYSHVKIRSKMLSGAKTLDVGVAPAQSCSAGRVLWPSEGSAAGSQQCAWWPGSESTETTRLPLSVAFGLIHFILGLELDFVVWVHAITGIFLLKNILNQSFEVGFKFIYQVKWYQVHTCNSESKIKMVLNNVNCHGILWSCVKWSIPLVHYKCVVTEFQWDTVFSLPWWWRKGTSKIALIAMKYENSYNGCLSVLDDSDHDGD